MDVQFNQRPGSMEVWDYGLSADAGHMSAPILKDMILWHASMPLWKTQ